MCKIGNEIKNFVLDCVEKVCEVASWVNRLLSYFNHGIQLIP
jgi:hypothetical protein